jgi:hypothetical protein
VWNVVGCGLLVVGTLLGPEGTGRSGRCDGGWVGFLLGAPCSSYRSRLALGVGVGSGGGGCGVTARTLRTAQWTRASIFLVGMYLDTRADP